MQLQLSTLIKFLITIDNVHKRTLDFISVFYFVLITCILYYVLAYNYSGNQRQTKEAPNVRNYYYFFCFHLIEFRIASI